MEILRIRLRVQVLNSSLTDQNHCDPKKESDLATLSGRAGTGTRVRFPQVQGLLTFKRGFCKVRDQE